MIIKKHKLAENFPNRPTSLIVFILNFPKPQTLNRGLAGVRQAGCRFSQGAGLPGGGGAQEEQGSGRELRSNGECKTCSGSGGFGVLGLQKL